MRFFKVLMAAGAMSLAGCATWNFKAERENQFVDEEHRFLFVEYGKGEVRETEFTTPTGVRLPFKSALQVRVTTPDGERFVAYQNMSLVSGNLYVSDDRQWEYWEKGTGCLLAELDGDGYVPRFQGVLCRNGRVKSIDEKKPKIRSGGSTPHDFGRESSGPRDSSGPRSVEQK